MKATRLSSRYKIGFEAGWPFPRILPGGVFESMLVAFEAVRPPFPGGTSLVDG